MDKHSRLALETKDTASCNSSSGEGTSYEEPPRDLTHLTSAEAFSRMRSPFQVLCASLSYFISLSWQHNIQELLDRIVNNTGIEILPESELDRSKIFVDELAPIPPNQIGLRLPQTHPCWMWFQRHIESMTKSKWIWWPFDQPHEPLQRESRYIGWEHLHGFFHKVWG